MQPLQWVVEVVQDLSPVGAMCDVGFSPAAEDEVGTGRVRTVHDLVGRLAGWRCPPARPANNVEMNNEKVPLALPSPLLIQPHLLAR